MEGQDDSKDDTAQVDGKQVSPQITGDKNVIFVNSNVTLTVNNIIGAGCGHVTSTLDVNEIDDGSKDVDPKTVDSENKALMVTNGSGDGTVQNFSRLLSFKTSAAIQNGYISRWKSKITNLAASGAKKMGVKCDQELYYCRESEIAAGSVGAHVFVGIFGGKPVAIKRCVLYSVKEKDKLVARSLQGKPLAHVLIPDRIIEDDHFIYYVSKLCEWNVREVIEEASNPLRSVLNPVRRQQMCVELLKGLKELQVDLKILHRDLKPSNVLLDHNGKVLICDFGVSRLLIDKTSTVTEGVGSLCWMAKEVLKGPDVYYTMSADIQVAGFLVYYILTDGHIPHESTYPYKMDTASVIENIRKDKYSLRHLKEHDVFESLLEDMINPVAEHRPSISECLSRFQNQGTNSHYYKAKIPFFTTPQVNNIIYDNSAPLYKQPMARMMFESDETSLREYVKKQIEYYFSIENLVKDLFVRRKMDSEGYLPLAMIAGFHRLRALTKNMDLIIEALRDSTQVELSTDLGRIRCKEDPLKWVITGAQIPATFHSELSYDSPEFIPGQPYPFHQMDTATSTSEGGQENFQVDPEELDFQFDAELTEVTGRKNTFSEWSDDDSDYEMDDEEINKILIVTQTPHDAKKYPGGDESRAKMTADLSDIINDGLYYYEMDLLAMK